MQRKKIVAVIPARGGSKGIPLKNLQKVGGIPLVGRTIQAAKSAKADIRIYVSTDSHVIAGVAQYYGAEVISRPESISGDTSSSESALIHAVQFLEQRGVKSDILIMLQCTSPFTTGEAIDAVVDSLEKSQADMAFSAVEDHGFIWSIDDSGNGVGINHDPRKPRMRRQDLSIQLRETGAIYAMRTELFLRDENRFCGKILPVQILLPALEIDSMQDLILARALAEINFDEINSEKVSK